MLGKSLGRRLKIIFLHVVCKNDGAALIVNDLEGPLELRERTRRKHPYQGYLGDFRCGAPVSQLARLVRFGPPAKR